MSGVVSSAAQLNPWRPLGPCSPAACVEVPAAAAGAVRLMARLSAALLVVVAGVPLSFAISWMTAARRAAVIRAWARLMLRALGLRVEVEIAPEARNRGGLVVANHISWLDPLVIAATMPARPLAKREIAGWPVIGRLVAGSGALFIDRERLYALPATVAAVAAVLRQGDSVVAFPEGTTWCGRGMGRFRPAVFQAAIDAGAPVLPATLRYREGAEISTRACFVGDDSLLASLLRVAATRHLAVEVTLHTPIPPAPAERRPEARAPLPGVAPARAALAGTAEGRIRENLGAAGHIRFGLSRPSSVRSLAS
ncbi:lysophospholipid acyltransferase family protein [Nonomuraea sp. SYSU D8015]|uniref:lysophospholipid acyltransferase family protein n=1 Tax=Nonomuraea sp. SYSU D8015 TaxID=2593644 RepID=UPI001CB74934|nr:lysophospholipid acyltransferase family protein [Nonomuraea sp. SYSU D8015]